MDLTYHQVLADMYEDTANNLLVHSAEPDESEPVEPMDKHPDELPNQEDFQKPQPSHQMSAMVTASREYADNTKTSVLYTNKHVRIHVLNIDSRFRDNIDPKVPVAIANPTNFVYKFRDMVKNVISMKITGIEIPNTMYVFQGSKNNLRLVVAIGTQTLSILVPEGNYDDICILCALIQDKLNLTFTTANFVVSISDISGKLTISSSEVFSITFHGISKSLYGNGIGYHLGFKQKLYSGLMSYTSENIVNSIESNYIFLSLGPSYPVITHRYYDSQTNHITDMFAFAKILVDVPKNSVIFDNGTNVITKEYFFHQPTNIQSVPVQVLDAYGNIVDLNGLNFSFTLELTEVVDHALYKLMTEVNT
jgi:hypothetical protein